VTVAETTAAGVEMVGAAATEPDAKSRCACLRGCPCPKCKPPELRKFLIQILYRHLEKKLATPDMLEMGGL